MSVFMQEPVGEESNKVEEKKTVAEKRHLEADSTSKNVKKQRKNTEKLPKEKPKKVEAHDDLPMNVPFRIVDGVRHLSPYWAVYRTRTKGRWIGRKMVEVFSQEFLSTNRNYAKVACKLGRIYVNGVQMTNIDYVMKNNDQVEHWAHRHEHPVRDLPIEIVSDTDDLLVVNKPPSLPVHACGQYAIHTVLGQLRVNHGRTGLRVLHRLDRTTSGILLFAKNYETDLEFKSTLKQGCWTKEYVCKLEGDFPEGEITVDQPIGPLVISMGIQCIRPDGKSAQSTFSKIWSNGSESVVKVTIATGRTHQIRVHAQYLGFPIVGDQVYNSKVWGVEKGKGGKYGKEFGELCKDVQSAHKCENWHEEPNLEYEQRMEKMAEDPVDVEPVGMKPEDRPQYDPICLKCNVETKKVPPGHYQLFLHCLRYETEKWCFKTELPEWAVQKEGN